MRKSTSSELWYNIKTAKRREEVMIVKALCAAIIFEQSGFYTLEVTYKGEVRRFPEITREEAKLSKLASMINKGEVSPIHIEEIIEDVIG